MPDHPEQTHAPFPPERLPGLPAVALLGALIWALSGCPGGSESSESSGGPVDECRETGQQCRLGDGKLGVCTREVEGEIDCVPQH